MLPLLWDKTQNSVLKENGKDLAFWKRVTSDHQHSLTGAYMQNCPHKIEFIHSPPGQRGKAPVFRPNCVVPHHPLTTQTSPTFSVTSGPPAPSPRAHHYLLWMLPPFMQWLLPPKHPFIPSPVAQWSGLSSLLPTRNALPSEFVFQLSVSAPPCALSSATR